MLMHDFFIFVLVFLVLNIKINVIIKVVISAKGTAIHIPFKSKNKGRIFKNSIKSIKDLRDVITAEY